MPSIQWTQAGEWRYLIDISMNHDYRAKLKSEMVRDICMRCSSEEEKAKRRDELKAFNQFQKDEVDRVTQNLMGDLKGKQVKLRYRGELAFKDKTLRDAVAADLSLPTGWESYKTECGGALAF